MKPSSELQSFVDQMPDPDRRGMYAEIDKEKVEKAVEEIHKGGSDSIAGLIDMLVPPGEGDDAKARYALHCLAVHLSGLEDDKPREQFARTVAAGLEGDRPNAVKCYLCRVLQTAGGGEVAPSLGKLLPDEELCEPAAQALVAIESGAAEQFRGALPKAQGKCRLTVVQNLGVVRDTGSVAALQAAMDDQDPQVRLAAAWALANIGDAGSVDLVIKAADGKGWERIQATKACLLLAENLLEAGKQTEAVKIYSHLRNTRTGPAERYVREAAEKALAGAR
jgi:hypothetical protein